MKLILSGDWHIRQSAPKNRTDNYFETQRGKIGWILGKVKETVGGVLVVAGDVFDSYQASDFLKREYIQLIKESGVKVIGVAGQHDQRHHTPSTENTPLGVLDAAQVFHIIRNDTPYQLFDSHRNEIMVYGASFNEDIPPIKNNNCLNILVIHKMIVEEKLWEGQEEHVWAQSVLRRTKFDVIVAGDNHRQFISKYKDRVLINCGSLMRSTIDQTHHTPSIVLYDTTNLTYSLIPLPCLPIAEVMNLTKVEKDKKRNEKLEAFVKGLSEQRGMDLDFMKNLQMKFRQDDVAQEIREIIMECAEG